MQTLWGKEPFVNAKIRLQTQRTICKRGGFRIFKTFGEVPSELGLSPFVSMTLWLSGA